MSAYDANHKRIRRTAAAGKIFPTASYSRTSWNIVRPRHSEKSVTFEAKHQQVVIRIIH